jgi:hypothetical protein
MIDRDLHSPRRYFVDSSGHRVLVGLTIEETVEFESLDRRPSDDSNALGTPERWRELYTKHDEAWRAWMVRTSADRPNLNDLLTIMPQS